MLKGTGAPGRPDTSRGTAPSKELPTSVCQHYLFSTQMSVEEQVCMEALCPWQAAPSLSVEMERVRRTHSTEEWMVIADHRIKIWMEEEGASSRSWFCTEEIETTQKLSDQWKKAWGGTGLPASQSGVTLPIGVGCCQEHQQA